MGETITPDPGLVIGMTAKASPAVAQAKRGKRIRMTIIAIGALILWAMLASTDGGDSMLALEIVLGLGFTVLLIYGILGAGRYPPQRDSQIICPHCQIRGRVITRGVKLKKGVSGGKAAGALLTGGLSVLAVGLTRKERATEATCFNCGSVWHF